MSKITRGRLTGMDEIQKLGAAKLYEMANGFEAQIRDPKNPDDPKWLHRWADKVRKLAEQKEKSVRMKARAK